MGFSLRSIKIVLNIGGQILTLKWVDNKKYRRRMEAKLFIRNCCIKIYTLYKIMLRILIRIDEFWFILYSR